MSHSLQCPRCTGAVQVADNASGTRVRCPHCEQTFLVPGFASSTNDDDDWLKIDDQVPPPKSKAARPGSITTLSSNTFDPALGNDAAAPLQDVVSNDPFQEGTDDLFGSGQASGAETDLDDGLPPFEMVAPAARPRSPTSPVDLSALDGFDEVPPPNLEKSHGEAGADPDPFLTPDDSPKPLSPESKSPEYMTEYRVRCLTCGSMTYAKAAQQGKTIKCHDCYSQITVPPPPRVPKKPTIDMESAETFRFEDSKATNRPADPFLKSAEELLRNAENQEASNPEPDFDTPDIMAWAKNVFGIFLDPGVLAHWIILSVFASIPAYVALAFESKILILGLFPAGIIFGVVVLGCAFAILQSLANEEDRVSEWPAFDPGEWFGQMMVASAAIAIAAVPSYGAAFMAFGHSLPAVAITMMAIYAMFPFLILSILDMQSITTPFSPEVAKSVTRCEESWGGFYLTSGILFVLLFMVFVASSSMPPPTRAVACIFFGVAGLFTYFAMIGRLAFAIGQVVNDKPLANNIDRSKKTDST